MEHVVGSSLRINGIKRISNYLRLPFPSPACSSSCLTKYLKLCCGASPVVKKYTLLNSNGNKNGHSRMSKPHQGGVHRLTTVSGSCSCVESFAVNFELVNTSSGSNNCATEDSGGAGGAVLVTGDSFILCNTRNSAMSCSTSVVIPPNEEGEEEEEKEDEEEEEETSSAKDSLLCSVVFFF